MSSQFGHAFRISTWGESHGGGVGVVIDGCPPRMALSEADIQRDLDRRRPGQSEIVTPRDEADRVPDPLRRLRGQHARHADLHRGDEQGRAPRGLSRDGDAPSALRTPTTPTRRSTASATGRAGDAPRRARPSAAWPRRPSRRRCWRSSRPALEIVAYVKIDPRDRRRGRSRRRCTFEQVEANIVRCPDARDGGADDRLHQADPQRRRQRRRRDRVRDPRRCRRGSASRSSTSSRPTSRRR